MTSDAEVVQDPSCFDIPQWRALHESDPEGHIFSAPEWQRAWWEEFSANKDLFCLCLKRARETFAIVPLYRKNEPGRRILRFVGGLDLTDYLGPICMPEDRAAAARGLVRWLTNARDEWDEFDARSLPVPAGFADALVDFADRAGFDLTVDQEEVSGVLDLPASWDAYLTQLPSKERHELRRKRRRLDREAPDAHFRRAAPATLKRDLKIFFEMHRGAEGHKGHFMKPEIATFFARIAHAFTDIGALRLDFLMVGGREIAATFSFEYREVFYLYNSAYEPEMKRLSPGLNLVARLVSQAIAEGLHRFDFLRGPERYKFQLGAAPVPLNAVRIMSPRAS